MSAKAPEETRPRASRAAGTARPPVHAEPRPHWMQFMGHLTELRTLDGTTRRMAVLAVLLAPLALLALVLPTGLTPVVAGAGLHGRLPVVVLGVGACVAALGWWYLLAGSAAAPAWVRWLVALTFAAAQAVAAAATVLAFVSALLPLVYAVLVQRGVLRGTAAALAAAGLVVVFYGTLVLAGPSVLAEGMQQQRAVFYFLATPLIFYSGVELGETGLFLARIGVWHLHPRVRPEVLWWVALGLVAVKFVLMFRVYPNNWSTLALMLLLAVGAFCTSRCATRSEPPPSFVMALTLVFFLAAFGVGQMPVAIAAIAAALAVLLLAGRDQGRATIGVYLLILGLWIASQATEYALDEVISLAAFGYLVYLRLRGPMRVERVMLVIFWVVGFSMLNVTYDLLTALSRATRGAQGIVVLLLIIAVIHDLATSGSLLNHGSPHMPRRARVLMYLGYALVSVGGTVLANGPSGTDAFRLEIDPLQLSGLIILGMPLFLQQFLHAFSFGHRPQEPACTQRPEPAAALEIRSGGE